MSGMDAIVREFLAESAENLDQLDQDLVSLEKHPDDREMFARIFRTIHTIKGTCGFLAFGRLEEVTHAGESLLSHLRDGTLELRPEITSSLLAMIDAVRSLLAAIETTGGEGEVDYSRLIGELRRFDQEAAEKKKRAAERVVEPSALKPTRIALDAAGEEATPTASAASGAAGPRRRRPRSGTGVATDGLTGSVGPGAAAPAEAPDAGGAGEGASTGEPGDDPERTSSDAPSQPALGESSLRVDVGVLDHLMNLVGELVLARNQILQYTTGLDQAELVAASQRLNGITGELQEAVMRTRMQPILSIWNKLPRFVRDLAHGFAKEVEIEMEGQDTDLDKSVIEAIKGSLLHLVRNAVDHGIETPAERQALGKPRQGTLRLRAHHEGGNVVIEVSDDGRGIDRQAVLERGLRAGLVRPENAARLSAREIEALIFRPGFSTARKVTNVSGRGVGLDIVLNNVESIGGSVEIQSEPGSSTTFRLKIPLTLAIIPVLRVSAAGHRFAIPQAGVVELVRLGRDGSSRGVERLHGVPVYRLRGHLLPLLFLERELGLGDGAARDDRSVSIVVLQGDDRQFGLVVDVIEDSQEIVVKPLSRLLAGLPYAGATILGDGNVSLILDVVRLGLAAGVVSEGRAHAPAVEPPGEGEEAGDRVTLLFLQGANDERLALGFEHVTRLEFIPRSKIEQVGGLPVVQYRGEILSLVVLDETLPERRHRARNPQDSPTTDAVQVVVCSVDGRSVGVVVHRILDIVEQVVSVRRSASRPGIEACIVIQDRVTELVDLRVLIRLADPEFFERARALPQAGTS